MKKIIMEISKNKEQVAIKFSIEEIAPILLKHYLDDSGKSGEDIVPLGVSVPENVEDITLIVIDLKEQN